MNGQSGMAPALDLRAVGLGVLWGIGTLLLGSVVQGVVGHSSQAGEVILPLMWQAFGALLGGFQAARRASGAGWLHGAIAGVMLMLCLAVGMGIADSLPAMAVLMKMVGVGAGIGILGGIGGVNLGR